MDGQSFAKYIADEDIHDGEIAKLQREEDDLIVSIKSGGWKRKQGQVFKVIFRKVSFIREHKPIGRLLYALSEVSSSGPGRHFCFAADDDEPCLEVVSMDVAIQEEP